MLRFTSVSKHQGSCLLPASIKTASLGLRLRVFVSRSRGCRCRIEARGRSRRRSHVVLNRSGKSRCCRWTRCTTGIALVVHGRPSCLHAAFAPQNDLSPGLGLAASGRGTFADGISQDLHPAILVGRAVGVEVDDLAVSEADPEAFFHKHVALFLFGKRRLTPSTTPGCCFSLGQRRSIVNQLHGFGKVDSGPRLTCRFMVGG